MQKNKCGRKALRKAEIEDIVIGRTVKTVMSDAVLDRVADRVFEFQNKENTVLPPQHASQPPSCRSRRRLSFPVKAVPLFSANPAIP